MIGSTISHYRILEKLGEGGMGVVYKARDLRLKRAVALKFLPDRVNDDESSRSRFLQEAQSAAALNHPNICVIHSVEEHEGSLFMALEYVDGETLRKTITNRQLSIDNCITYATQIGEALSAAHEKGIVHRDIKPDNIMVTSKGLVKVMDFGLARLRAGLGLTKTVSTAGTIAYMSPEQIQSSEVDHRSDIWSFGVVLYEMLAGRLPFRGEHQAAMVYSITNEEAQPISLFRPELAPYVQAILARALEKDKGRRYQSFDEILSDLRQPSYPVSIVRQEKSIAVLPFQDMSPENDQEYFCDGLAEELINALTKLKDVRVVARTSAFSFKGKDLDVREMGRKLNVKTVLEGSVRKVGNRLRITTQLISVSDGYHLWSEKYDRDLTDVFAIQDEIALATVEKLRMNIAGDEKKLMLKRHTENVEAHSLYLKGRYYAMLFSEGSRAKALECYIDAVEKDPQYALAYCGLSDLYCMMGLFSPHHPEEMYRKAKSFAEKAISMDSDLGEAFQASAFVKMFFERDWSGAEKHFKRALKLSPGSAVVHVNYGLYAMAVGRSNEAIAAGKRATELDPLSPTTCQLFGFICFGLGLFDESISELRKALELNPGHSVAHLEIGWNYAFKGMFKEAMIECEKAEKQVTEFDPWLNTTIACVFAMAGEMDRAQKTLEQMKEFSKSNYIDPLDFAVLYTWLGDREEAFRWLEKGFRERSTHMYFIRPIAHLWLKPMSSDSRFKAILKKMGFGEQTPGTHGEFSPQKQEQSIVVLPFENNSPDNEDEYFSDGLTEEIITDLSKIHSLRVISRSSSMRLKGTHKDVKTLGRELNVRYVLEGSVRKAKESLRITVELVNAENDIQLWAEKYNGTVEDVFDVQENVSRSIAEALKIQLSPEEDRRIKQRPIDNIGAYESYWKAYREISRFNEAAVSRAVEYLTKSLQINGDNALIYSALAHAHYIYAHIGIDRKDHLTKAEEYVQKALALDPDCTKAHIVLGWIDFFGYGNAEEGTRHFRRALATNPTEFEALHVLASIHCYAGKIDAAEQLSKRMMDIDPLNPHSYRIQGVIHYSNGRFEEALLPLQKAHEMDPENRVIQIYYAFALAQTRRLEKAFSIIDQMEIADPGNVETRLALLLKYGLTKNREKVMAVMTPEFQETCRRSVLSWSVAVGLSLLDAKDEALEWLERAVHHGYINYPMLNKHDPFLENIRGEERFQKLMGEVKKKWDAFEV